MKVDVKCMFQGGEILTAEAIEDSPRFVGDLVVEDLPAGNTNGARQARLLSVDGPHKPRDVIPSLVAPQLVTITGDRMILRGYQIHINPETGVVRQYHQGWILHLSQTNSTNESR